MKNIPKLNEESIASACAMSILATAGLFYVNLGGAFLSAFVDGLGIGRDIAGFIVSANKYGAAAGALVAIFIVKKVNWRITSLFLLVSMISVDLISSHISAPNSLIVIRFFHGVIGGISVGLGLSVIARSRAPDKVFGMLLVIQYSFGSLGIFFVPRLVEVYGHNAVFAILSLFTLMTLCLLPFIPDVTSENAPEKSSFKLSINKPLILGLTALFLFQAANMGIADYVFELGKEKGLSISETSNILTVANIISISGGGLVYLIGLRYGRRIPLIIGFGISILFSFILIFSDYTKLYFLANAMTGIAWGFVIPYLLGLCSSFEKSGQNAAAAGFVSKMGLATGPLVGAVVINTLGFTGIIFLGATALSISLVLVFLLGNDVEGRII